MINARGPQSNEPTGALNPFDRQNMVVSVPAVSSLGAAPSAMAAFQIRAPSQCTAKPASRATAVTASSSVTRQGRPDAGMCVFSTNSAEIAGRWCCCDAAARATSAGASVPSASGSGRSCAALLVAAAACS